MENTRRLSCRSTDGSIRNDPPSRAQPRPRCMGPITVARLAPDACVPARIGRAYLRREQITTRLGLYTYKLDAIRSLLTRSLQRESQVETFDSRVSSELGEGEG